MIHAVVTCGRVLHDTATGLHTLVDVQLGVATPELPCERSLCFYLTLSGLLGASEVTIEVVRLADEQVLLRGNLALEVAAGRDDLFGLATPPALLRFDQAGRHELRVHQGDQVAARQPFDVRLVAPAAPADA